MSYLKTGNPRLLGVLCRSVGLLNQCNPAPVASEGKPGGLVVISEGGVGSSSSPGKEEVEKVSSSGFGCPTPSSATRMHICLQNWVQRWPGSGCGQSYLSLSLHHNVRIRLAQIKIYKYGVNQKWHRK